jgi:hypothetical protein
MKPPYIKLTRAVDKLDDYDIDDLLQLAGSGEISIFFKIKDEYLDESEDENHIISVYQVIPNHDGSDHVILENSFDQFFRLKNSDTLGFIGENQVYVMETGTDDKGIYFKFKEKTISTFSDVENWAIDDSHLLKIAISELFITYKDLELLSSNGSLPPPLLQLTTV